MRADEGHANSPLLARDRARRAVRAYFESQDFLEVETPTFTDCPGLDPHVHSLGQVEDRGFLITSPEFHMKRLLVRGMPRIYQLARCFRAEEHGPWHEPEFTLLEWYRSPARFEAILRDTECIVRAVAQAVRGKDELVVADFDRPPRSVLVDAPFVRLTVREAFGRFAGVPDAVALAERDEARFFQLLVDQVEPALAGFERPVFLTHYPACQASLARLCPDDPSVCERFECYVGGIELSNGFGELTDAAEQRRRFEAEIERRRNTQEPLYPLPERFLSALERGLPPSAGNALGFDRLMAFALGVDNVQATLAFCDADR